MTLDYYFVVFSVRFFILLPMKLFKLFTGLFIFINISLKGALFARLQPSFGLLFHLSSVV